MRPDKPADGTQPPARLPRPPIGRSTVDLPAVPPLPLAHGELNESETAELRELKAQIESAAGFRCGGYKEKCLRRRIAVRMRARSVHRYSDYAELLRGDPAEYERLVDTLTINVSKFFRNPEVWENVRTLVLPELFGSSGQELRVWSAGTAAGEEAYTVRMLVADYAAEHDLDDSNITILGTDIDRESLAQAGRGEYTDFSMTDIAPDVRDRWFERSGNWRLRPAARRNVRFDTLDLIRDEYPRDQHLIICRNVIIYFERSVQEELFRRFRDSLVPGGFLVLGKVEALFGHAAGLFRTVSARQRIFRRP
jgi:chemotaxis protein methyltransferase CheR